ncbi:MAG: tetratricopeptide repeat protein [Elusimicrobiota bacterium]|jgi:tetratricopeptide (TPR) repeat protein|nr:tetratricopeptide repeat protein [Elusimicrobiota bacterium]
MKKTTIAIISLLIFLSGISNAQNFDAYRFYLKGMVEQRSGKLKQAQKDYEKAVSADPDAFVIYQDLAYLYWNLGNKDAAIETVEKLSSIDGNNPRTTSSIGNFYLVANSTENAKKFWDKTLDLDPQNESALYSLAAQYLVNNDFVQSEKYWKKFLEQEPESIPGHLQLGLTQEKRNELDAALKTYDELIKLKPEVGEAYIAKARIYETSNRLQLAAQEFDKLLKYYPQNPYVLINLGRYYFLTNNLEKASAVLKEAEALSPNDLNASYWLGSIYERQGDFDNAIYRFESITKIEENIFIMTKLGYFYAAKRDYKNAEKYFLKALTKDPNNIELMFFIGLNYMDMKKYGKSIEYFTRLIALNPNFADGYFFIGDAYYRNGNLANAETNLKRAIELNPQHIRAKNLLGYIYADNNINLPQAQDLLETIASQNPQNGAILDSLGWLYYRIAQQAPVAQKTILMERAQRVLLASANISHDSRAYEHLGDVYCALNNFSDAWVVYSLAYEINPEKQTAKKIENAKKHMTDKEISSKSLFMSESHYLKLFSLKTGYKVEAASGLFSEVSYISLSSIKEEGILLTFPSLMADIKIYIKDGKVIYDPQASKTQFPPQVVELITLAAAIFGSDFLRNFDNIDAQKKGNELIYQTPSQTLVLDDKTSLIKQIIKDDIVITVLKNGKFLTSQIPSKIKITSKKWNFAITLEADNFNFAQEHIVVPKN